MMTLGSSDLLMYGADIMTETGKESQVFCFESYLTKEACITLILNHYPNGAVIEALTELGNTTLLTSQVGEVGVFVEEMACQYQRIMTDSLSKADDLRDLLNQMDLALHDKVLSEQAIRESHLAQALYAQMMEAKNQAVGLDPLIR